MSCVLRDSRRGDVSVYQKLLMVLRTKLPVLRIRIAMGIYRLQKRFLPSSRKAVTRGRSANDYKTIFYYSRRNVEDERRQGPQEGAARIALTRCRRTGLPERQLTFSMVQWSTEW